MATIGIDLGTTNCCVGVWSSQKESVEILTNSFGKRTTPSVISIQPSKGNGNPFNIIKGEMAQRQQNIFPKTTIYESKRFIGRTFKDPLIQNDLDKYPFKITNDANRIRFSINDSTMFSPEEVAGELLKQLKMDAEKQLNQKIKNIVITVPAYFNDTQRQATHDAAKLAGIKVLRLLNEPTAAAIAYGLDKQSELDEDERHVFVFDIGGGTIDTSLLCLTDDGVFEVEAVCGNTHLGGANFDQRIMKFIMEEYKKNFKKDFPIDNVRTLNQLRNLAEQVKCELSSIEKTQIFFQIKDEEMNIEFSRTQFEDLCLDLFISCMNLVKNTLNDASILPSNVHDIILVGGSSRIPKLQEMLTHIFDGKVLCKDLNPDECVAIGATLYAAVLAPSISEESKPDILLVDVVPLSLGLETKGGMMTNLIDRNSAIPCLEEKYFSTAEDDQTSITVKVFEGERSRTIDNRLLGEFDLEGIEKAARGFAKIRVAFEIDENGILKVSAKDMTNNDNEKELIIESKSNERMTDSELKRLIKTSKEKEEEDIKYRKNVETKLDYENFLYAIRRMMESHPIILENLELQELKDLKEFITKELKEMESQDIEKTVSSRDKSFVQERYLTPISKKLEINIQIVL